MMAASNRMATNIPANAPDVLFSGSVEPTMRSVTGSSQFPPRKSDTVKRSKTKCERNGDRPSPYPCILVCTRNRRRRDKWNSRWDTCISSYSDRRNIDPGTLSKRADAWAIRRKEKKTYAPVAGRALLMFTFGTRGTGESRFTVTGTVDGATRAAVLAFALETAIDAVRTGRAHGRTIRARPSRITVAQACGNSSDVILATFCRRTFHLPVTWWQSPNSQSHDFRHPWPYDLAGQACWHIGPM